MEFLHALIMLLCLSVVTTITAPSVLKLLSWQQFCFQIGFQAIVEALGLAAVKALVAISAIIASGRLVSHAYFKSTILSIAPVCRIFLSSPTLLASLEIERKLL